MNGRIDVIEVLRRANPVPPNTIDERTCPTAGELRAALRTTTAPVPVTLADDERQTRLRPRWPKYAAGVAAVAASVAALGVLAFRDSAPVDPATTTEVPIPASDPRSPFLGTWITTDGDGSTPTMVIRASGGEAVEIVVREDAASVCSGAASTMTGTGRLEGATELVIPSPVLTCDDGSEPEALSGPALEEQLRNLTFVDDPASDALTDSFAVVWRPEGDETAPTESEEGGMWPQSSVDEVREAQELADAGDPAYTWQIDPQLSSDEWWEHLVQPGAEIAERFLRDELGWEEFLFSTLRSGDVVFGEPPDGIIRGVEFLRCKPGETNPLYPTAGQGEALGADRCAPTIDDLRYETVSLDLSQLARRGRTGIWVVSRWAMTAPFAQADPRAAETEATARLEDFLAARVEGEGAEGYVDVIAFESPGMTEEVPLLYTTTTGAPYERYEIERVSEPRWPYGEMEFTVRLFAEDGAVVEQQISWGDGGGLWHRATETMENGQPVPQPYVAFNGEVTLSAPDPWQLNPMTEFALTLNGQFGDERVELVRSPLPVATGCAQGPRPADADALAESIQSDPDLVATAPVDVSVGAAEGLAMDITVAPGASVCETFPSTLALTQGAGYSGPRPPGVDLEDGSRMRLYLLNRPEVSATRILAIAVVAPQARFEDVIAAAAPIIESIEFHTN